MGAIRIQGNQENKEMEEPPWEKKSCVTRKEWQKLGLSLPTNGVRPTVPGSKSPTLQNFLFNLLQSKDHFICHQSDPTDCVGAPAADSFLSVPSVWVQGSLPNRT